MTGRPLELARLALERLEECADSRTAAQARTFFKPEEMVHLFGVKSPKLREIELELFQNIRKSWNLDEALRFCDILVRDPHVEAKSLGLLLLAMHLFVIRHLMDDQEEMRRDLYGWPAMARS